MAVILGKVIEKLPLVQPRLKLALPSGVRTTLEFLKPRPNRPPRVRKGALAKLMAPVGETVP